MATDAPTGDSSLLGSSTLLLGAPGSGKTYSLVSYIKAGLDLFVLITDPRGEESLLDAVADQGLDINKLHYAYVASATPSWNALLDMAKKVRLMGYKDLAELKTGIAKDEFQQFPIMLNTLANFKCDRTGEEFGPVDDWGVDRALALDSLSGVSTMALGMMIGAKPTAHQGEWGVAMASEMQLIRKLCADVKCYLTVTAHLETEMDETIGRPRLMASALGRKNAPKLPKDFSDVVHAYRDGSSFFWSTTTSNIDLKTRNLPLKDKIAPDFGQMVEARKRRVKLTETQTETKTP